jgi:hypothetical protein
MLTDMDAAPSAGFASNGWGSNVVWGVTSLRGYYFWM